MDQAWYASKIAWFQTHKDDSYGSLSTVSLCCTQLFIHQHLFVVARWYTPSSNLFSFQRTPPLGSIILTYLSRGEVWAWGPQNIFWKFKMRKIRCRMTERGFGWLSVRIRQLQHSFAAPTSAPIQGHLKTKHGTNNEDFHRLKRVKYLANCSSLPDLGSNSS